MHWILIIVCGIFGVLGGLLLLVSAAFAFQTLWLLSCGRRVTATVVGYRNEEEEFRHEDLRGVRGTTSVTFHTPVFHFEDQNGERQEAEGMGTTSKRFRKGELVELIYSPGNPGRCVLDRFTDKWVPTLTVFGVAAILLVFPGLYLFVL